MGMVGWGPGHAADEVRLSNMSNFSTLDELGRFLEWGLHGWLHIATARMWNERVLETYESPRSTYFWQLHGLIDQWRQQWVDFQAMPQPEINPNILRDIQDLQEIVRRLPVPFRWPPEPPNPVPPPRPGPDPAPPLNLSTNEIRLIQALRRLR